MLDLARSRTPADRERLLMEVAGLCEAGLTGNAQGLVHDIFMRLVGQAESDLRARLAEKLAPAAWAPPALIRILALDQIEIARPVIARSPMLADADLLRVLAEATLEHQIEVARRPGVGPGVVSAILEQSQPEVVTALAGNQTAQATSFHMHRLVIASRRLAGLRGPLARHPKLTDNLAQTLYGWVGEALRASLAERFNIDPARLGEPAPEAVSETADSPWAEGDQAEMERRLVAKLNAAGNLRPGYLLRALREGRRTLFQFALATLGGYDPEDISRAILGNRADLLALACAGVGIDRSVFPTILDLVQALNEGRPVSGVNARAMVAEAFARPGPEAAGAFRESARLI